MAPIEQLFNALRESLKPDPIMTISDWADAHRILSRKSSAEPGKWSTKRTPYLREIMDVLSITHPAKKVVFKKCSQCGATETGNNFIGYIIDHCPAPTMLVLPTIDTAKRNSHLRIEPLIEECPRIKAKVSAPKSRNKTNSVLQKDFDGGVLVITGANSAIGLKSVACRFVMYDEIDEYPHNVENQGSPVALVAARSRTFSRRKAFLCSTPTYEGVSQIDQEFEESDQRHCYVPCPHCGHKQILDFKNLQWEPGKPKTVLYYCESCGTGIEERYKTKMLEACEWRAHNPGHETIGFFLNSLYSPIGWLGWSEIATEYEKAKREIENEKKDELMVVFHNTILGLSYKQRGESPDWKRLYLRRENYEIGTVNERVLFITMGVDVQKDRIEASVYGWGKKKISWLVEHVVFRGDTSAPEVWRELAEQLERIYSRTDGVQMPIRMTCIDSGFNTQHVYNFCRQYPTTKVVPVKGADNLMVLVGLPKAVDAKLNGKKLRRAVKVWNIGVSILKAEFYGWLRLDLPIGQEELPSGFCHFPEMDEEFFKQLTSEKVLLKRNRKGFVTHEWVKERDRNEALDCRNYSRAAASLVGLDRMKDRDFDRFCEKFCVQPVAKPPQIENNEKENIENSVEPIIKLPKQPKKKREHASFWS